MGTVFYQFRTKTPLWFHIGFVLCTSLVFIICFHSLVFLVLCILPVTLLLSGTHLIYAMLILSYTFLCLISSAYSVPLFEYLRPKSSYIAPGLGRSNLNIFNPASHAANQCSLGPSSPEVFWYEQAVHNGVSPFIPSGEKWNVFRNAATKFGADRTGRSDAQQALQNAINGKP